MSILNRPIETTLDPSSQSSGGVSTNNFQRSVSTTLNLRGLSVVETRIGAEIQKRLAPVGFPDAKSETRQTRSCLILQNDPMNQYGQLTIAIPFRPGTKQAP